MSPFSRVFVASPSLEVSFALVIVSYVSEVHHTFRMPRHMILLREVKEAKAVIEQGNSCGEELKRRKKNIVIWTTSASLMPKLRKRNFCMRETVYFSNIMHSQSYEIFLFVLVDNFYHVKILLFHFHLNV